ncbi:MAG: hypothetical protein JWO50_442 [Candidatus Kaiserbacteria bacterium]|nr:hypothetical protein [Candidatus Kaiserbacteria bacterium]
MSTSQTTCTITNDEVAWEANIEAEIPVEVLEKYRTVIINDLQKNTELKGFRKGNAPQDLILAQYSPDSIDRMVAERAVQEELPTMLARENVPIVEAPRVTINIVESGKPVTFTARAGLAPKIETGDYKKLQTRFPLEKVTDVTDLEHTEALTHIRRERARIEAVEKGTSAIEAGELAKSLAEGDLPSIDDSFAQELGYADATAFGDALRSNIQNEKELQATQKHRAAILDELVKSATVKYPISLKEYELDEMEGQFTHDLSRAGITFEKYLADAKQTKEELRKTWEPGADNRAKIRLILADIARKENIDPPKEVLEHELEHAREHYKGAEETALRAHILHALRNEMTIRFLEGNDEPVGHGSHDHE